MTKAIVNAKRKKGEISRYIYGHFSEHLGRCIYEGLYVGENSDIPNVNGMRTDVVEALKALDIPVLRWPGGCFADDYHWRDGIGEKSQRPYMVNTNWGSVVENNHFGTHEFFELCRQLDTEPYICGNVGSGTVQEMRDWIEYMTFGGSSPLAEERRKNGQDEPWKLKFFGVGNENWGCGGSMRPEFYADQYRRYQTFIRNYGEEPVYKIACGANAADYNWTEVMMREARDVMSGLSLHYYTLPGTWGAKGDSLDFNDDEWNSTIKNAMFMEELVSRHSAVMDKYDPEKKVGLIVDEWGTWFDVIAGTNPGFLYQQSTMRDAVVAVLTLHIFHNHCDRVKMANLAQLVNVLQAPILTEGENMLKTPTYHVLRMMKNHMDAELLDVDYTSPANADVPKVSISASERGGEILISLCNTSLTDSENLSIELRDRDIISAEAELLTADDMHAHNTFENPNAVVPVSFTPDIADNTITVNLPSKSVMTICVK